MGVGVGGDLGTSFRVLGFRGLRGVGNKRGGIFFWLGGGGRAEEREREKGESKEGLILLRRFLNGWKGGTWIRFLLAQANF